MPPTLPRSAPVPVGRQKWYVVQQRQAWAVPSASGLARKPQSQGSLVVTESCLLFPQKAVLPVPAGQDKEKQSLLRAPACRQLKTLETQ